MKFILAMFIFSSVAVDDVCRDWFKSAEIKINKSCTLRCSVLKVDMGTFHCPNQCDDLCKKNCVIRPELGKYIIEEIRLPDEQKTIKTLPFSKSEHKLILKALSGMPNKFFDKHFKGVVKLKKPVHLFVHKAGMTYVDGHIIVYEATLKRPNIKRKLVHELAHHYHEHTGKNQLEKYKKYVNWKNDKPPREGTFLSLDAEDSVEEDFATGFEYYIFEPAILKNKLSHLYKWFSKTLGNQFDLQECQ